MSKFYIGPNAYALVVYDSSGLYGWDDVIYSIDYYSADFTLSSSLKEAQSKALRVSERVDIIKLSILDKVS